MSGREGEADGSVIGSGRSGRVLLVLALVMPLVLFLGAAWHDYRAEMRIARERVAVMASTLAEHAETVLHSIDLVLSRIADRARGRSWDELRASKELHSFLQELRADLPQVESVFLVAPDGFIAASSRAFPVSPFDAREREYFKGARGQKGIYISAPFRGQTQGTYAFALRRALFRDDAFDGVIAVTVYPGYFEALYRATLERPGLSTASLVRHGDGTLLLRYPEVQNAPARLPPGSPVLRAAAGGAERGIFMGPSAVDGRLRLGGFARLRRFPLLVSYTMDRSVILNAWYTHLAIFAIFAVLVGLALFVTARLTLARAAQQQRDLRLLLEETERRQKAETKLQQSQKMEALGRLTGGVAHDFNNLLAAILGGIELALKHVDHPRALRLLGMASEAAQRGAKLTSHMLAFSRKRDVALQPVDTNAVLEGMHELLNRTIGGLIRVRYDLAPNAWSILADPVQLEVAVLNLAVNARDAMPLGGDLTLATRNLPSSDPALPAELEPGDYVLISVTDSGEGMPEDVQRKAFEPFFTTKGPGKGTGLGLSMVFGLATQIGGTAVIDSTPQRGTTVTLYLRRAAALAGAPLQHAGDAAGMAPQHFNILLVDDDAAVRHLAAEMLQEAGNTVIAVENGREALEFLSRGEPIDLLVTDYAMPLMTGNQLVGEVRKRRAHLPILFITGYMETDALHSWSDLGQGVLRKPFSAEEFRAAVQNIMTAAASDSKVVPLRAR
jgi:signal transduction histidine kinase/ActR/RegA family two-component response regulator